MLKKMSREAIAVEARNLASELNAIQSTLKLGSKEREEKEDQIYERLSQLAEEIKANHSKHPRMTEIFLAITGSPVPSTISKLPIYTDKDRLFTQSPTTPKVTLFLEQMAENLRSLPPDRIQETLMNPEKDGPKELVQSFIHSAEREKWLNASAKETCHHCWNEVMQRIFIMAVEMVTVELKQRAHQIRTLTEQQFLTEEDAVYLIKLISQALNKTEVLLKEADSAKKSKQVWIDLIESVFRLVINLVNELMMRYVQLVKLRKRLK